VRLDFVPASVARLPVRLCEKRGRDERLQWRRSWALPDRRFGSSCCPSRPLARADCAQSVARPSSRRTFGDARCCMRARFREPMQRRAVRRELRRKPCGIFGDRTYGPSWRSRGWSSRRNDRAPLFRCSSTSWSPRQFTPCGKTRDATRISARRRSSYDARQPRGACCREATGRERDSRRLPPREGWRG
jgi:hypothetical protein